MHSMYWIAGRLAEHSLYQLIETNRLCSQAVRDVLLALAAVTGPCMDVRTADERRTALGTLSELSKKKVRVLVKQDILGQYCTRSSLGINRESSSGQIALPRSLLVRYN